MNTIKPHDEIRRELTREGSPFEMTDIMRDGVTVRAWRHAPASLRAMVENTRAFGGREFITYFDEHMTYQQHFERVAGLAHVLIDEYGIQKGDRVAIAMRNYPEWPVAFFAAACIGAIVVPLNAWWTPRELEFGLRDSGSSMLIVDQERWEGLYEVVQGMELPTLIARPTNPLPEGVRDLATVPAAAELPSVDIDPDDDATIFYTSGTTGTPKGAFGTHRNICGNVISKSYAGARDRLRHGDTLDEILRSKPEAATALLAVPFFHGTGCHSILLGAFHNGDRLVLMHKWDAGVALELMEHEQVNQFTGVPTMLTQLYTHPDFAQRDLSNMTSIGSGGAPAPSALVRRTVELLPQVTPANGYGMTETSSMTAANRGPDYVARPDSVGLPVAICDVEVADPLTREPLPTGQVGEIRIRGANVVTGYWNRPDATADTIIDGWLYTGDLGRIDEEGFLFVVDRVKDMIIRGGENIYSAVVEAAIKQHPAVVDCAVMGVPHEVLGEEVGAVVQIVPGTSLTDTELREFLEDHIARFMIPVHLLLQEDDLSRNASGKIVKRQIKDELLAAQKTS